MDLIILVDKKDKILGYKEKLLAHKNPVPLHRAISVVIFSPDKKKMLLQKRSAQKPTWPFFWSNACCTHPTKGESYKNAAERRLKEEMGIRTPLKEIFRFEYSAKYDQVWGEHELDTVFEGYYEGKIDPDPKEVAEYKWMLVSKLLEDVEKNSKEYTPWFKIILNKIFKSVS